MRVCDLPAAQQPTQENLRRAFDLSIESIDKGDTCPLACACVALAIALADANKRLAASVGVIAVITPNEATSESSNDSPVTH